MEAKYRDLSITEMLRQKREVAAGHTPTDRALSDVMATAAERAAKEPAHKYEPKPKTTRGPVATRIIECGETVAVNYEKQAEYIEKSCVAMIDELHKRAERARKDAINQADTIDAYLLRLRVEGDFDVTKETPDVPRPDTGNNTASHPASSGNTGNGEAIRSEAVGVEHDKQGATSPDLPTF